MIPPLNPSMQKVLNVGPFCMGRPAESTTIVIEKLPYSYGHVVAMQITRKPIRQAKSLLRGRTSCHRNCLAVLVESCGDLSSSLDPPPWDKEFRVE